MPKLRPIGAMAEGVRAPTADRPRSRVGQVARDSCLTRWDFRKRSGMRTASSRWPEVLAPCIRKHLPSRSGARVRKNAIFALASRCHHHHRRRGGRIEDTCRYLSEEEFVAPRHSTPRVENSRTTSSPPEDVPRGPPRCCSAPLRLGRHLPKSTAVFDHSDVLAAPLGSCSSRRSSPRRPVRGGPPNTDRMPRRDARAENRRLRRAASASVRKTCAALAERTLRVRVEIGDGPRLALAGIRHADDARQAATGHAEPRHVRSLAAIQVVNSRSSAASRDGVERIVASTSPRMAVDQLAEGAHEARQPTPRRGPSTSCRKRRTTIEQRFARGGRIERSRNDTFGPYLAASTLRFELRPAEPRRRARPLQRRRWMRWTTCRPSLPLPSHWAPGEWFAHDGRRHFTCRIVPVQRGKRSRDFVSERGGRSGRRTPGKLRCARRSRRRTVREIHRRRGDPCKGEEPLVLYDTSELRERLRLAGKCSRLARSAGSSRPTKTQRSPSRAQLGQNT